MNTRLTKSESIVIDAGGPITATDPDQIRAEEEFRLAAKAKEEALYAGEIERVMSYYADDVVSMQPGMADVVGKTILGEGMRPYLEANTIVGKLTLKGFWVSGDYATRYAGWEEVITPKDGGKPIHQSGRCFLGWKKIDGEWKVVSEFVNYLVPPTEIE